jgi:hypothetical protein
LLFLVPEIGKKTFKSDCSIFFSANAFLLKEKGSEHSSDPEFPSALATQYSKERGRAYLPGSEWDREFPRRYGRYAHLDYDCLST